MKGARLVLAVALVWLAGAAVSHAAFSLDWYTFDGGGGTSTGGTFAVSGTVGQPDAGPRHAGATWWVRGGL